MALLLFAPIVSRVSHGTRECEIFDACLFQKVSSFLYIGPLHQGEPDAQRKHSSKHEFFVELHDTMTSSLILLLLIASLAYSKMTVKSLELKI